jgi:hypothetical protein
MSETIFYSWQSDLPNSTNRGFIQTALEAAAKAIRDDESVEVQPVIDRDTAGVPGSPDISATIFGKIEQARVFVCDVSIINQASADKDRPTPNPNVLIELGYALKVLGPLRIIMVLNSAFGPPEQLPFDLRLKRVLVYSMPEQADERAPERKRLQAMLEQNLRTILEGDSGRTEGTVVEPLPLFEQARQAVEEQKANRVALITRYMRGLGADLSQIAPDLSKVDRQTIDEPLVQAINQTEELVAGFAHLSETVALMKDLEAAQAIYRGFGPILEGYNLQPGYSGSFLDVQFDFHKFVGFELFVTIVSKLVRHDQWDLIAELLSDGIYVANAVQGSGAPVSFQFICEYVQLLEFRKERLKSRRVSIRADLLNERHTTGKIAAASPMEEFMEGDFFLFLRSNFAASDSDLWYPWVPHSTLYLKSIPRFVHQCRLSKYAKRVLPALAVDDIPTFRTKFAEALRKQAEMFERRGSLYFFYDFKPSEIGSDKLVK